MNIMGENKMSYDQVIDTCVGVPKREDIVKNDKVQNKIWKPISHGAFVEALTNGIEHHGLQIVESSFALNKTGHLLVGGFQVTGESLPLLPGGINAEYELFVRHANDMSLGLQINAGVNLMVCTNGCMSGETIARHKHTKCFDINEWARDTALTEFITDCKNQADHIENLRSRYISDGNAYHCILESAKRGIIPLARAVDIYSEWKEPVFSKEHFEPGTAWKLYGDFTHVAQKCSAQRQLQIVKEASGIVEEFCDDQPIDVEVVGESSKGGLF
jgi:hypothetical protein